MSNWLMNVPSPAALFGHGILPSVVTSKVLGRSATVTVEALCHLAEFMGIVPMLENRVPTSAGPGGASIDRRVSPDARAYGGCVPGPFPREGSGRRRRGGPAPLGVERPAHLREQVGGLPVQGRRLLEFP